ncbi:MAG TPA: class I SAM-dependent methyltransferase [Azospirillum sp.]
MTISEEYRELNRQLHETNQNYGVSSVKWVDQIKTLISENNLTSFLDYGCGKALLLDAIRRDFGDKVQCQGYDPAIEKYAAPPQPADLVACTDVLEHIEPEYLDAVLDDLARLTTSAAFLVVATGPALKTLPDGRNTHLIQESYRWWLPRLWQRWDLHSYHRASKAEFQVIVVPKA